VSLDEALLAHDIVIEHFGGRQGILNRNGLESALARPYSGYYRSIERKGAALLESLAKNHGFVDGNKRTAILMLSLLVINSDKISILTRTPEPTMRWRRWFWISSGTE